MPRLFRQHLSISLLTALALLAAVMFTAEAGATSATHGAHHKAHKSKKKKRTKKRSRPVKRGPRKAPTRNGSAAAPARPVRPAVPVAPVVVPPKPPAGPAKPPAVPPKSPVVPPKPPTTPVPPVTSVPPIVTPPGLGPLDVLTPFPSGSRLFAPTSFWNRELPASEPLDPRSVQLVAALAAEVRSEVTKRTGPWINTNTWSVAAYTVGANVPNVHVTPDVRVAQFQRDIDAVPIPAAAHASNDGDATLVIYQPSTDTLWEFWHARRLADGWHAAWGGKMSNVSSNPGYFPNPMGASATSLPLLGGLVSINELKSGKIDHALALAVPNTDAAAVTWPAQRGDGRVRGAAAIPQGTHFRLDPTVDLSRLGLPPAGLAMARAAQRYGIVLRESSDCVTFYAEDATVTGSNPYPQLFRGLYANEVLAKFPWDRLQVVAPRKP
jgi:outer membrane biosynthesis protein TonB